MNTALWVSALILASIHIILSLAFTISYQTVDAPNFSIGVLGTLGAYQSFTLTRIMYLPVYYGLPLALVSGFIINSGIYLLVIKPLTDKNRSPVLITLVTLGLSLILTGLIHVFAYWLRDITNLYTIAFSLRNEDFNIGSIPGVFFISSLTAFIVYFVWRYCYWNTQAGIVYRAILENPQLANVQGVNIERTWLRIWGLSGSLACLAGALTPIWYSFSTNFGTQIITPIITASILGGLKNPRGFFIGGLIVGVSEVMLTTMGQEVFGVWIGEYRPLIPIALLVLCLRFIPKGLLGARASMRFKPSPSTAET